MLNILRYGMHFLKDLQHNKCLFNNLIAILPAVT